MTLRDFGFLLLATLLFGAAIYWESLVAYCRTMAAARRRRRRNNRV